MYNVYVFTWEPIRVRDGNILHSIQIEPVGDWYALASVKGSPVGFVWRVEIGHDVLGIEAAHNGVAETLQDAKASAESNLVQMITYWDLVAANASIDLHVLLDKFAQGRGKR